MTSRTRKRFGLVLELALMAASLSMNDPIPNTVRILGLIVLGICGSLVVFVCAVLAVAALDQRRPPYEV